MTGKKAHKDKECTARRRGRSGPAYEKRAPEGAQHPTTFAVRYKGKTKVTGKKAHKDKECTARRRGRSGPAYEKRAPEGALSCAEARDASATSYPPTGFPRSTFGDGRADPAPHTRRGPPRGPSHAPKRAMRARRPILPRASPAVLSAMAGLTAEFGMESGDPCLRGRARAGRSGARDAGPSAPGALAAACAGTRPPSEGGADRTFFGRVCEELGPLVPLA